MALRGSWFLCVALAASTTALAGPLPEGLRLVVVKNRLSVRQQGFTASLEVVATRLGAPRFDPARGTVTVRHYCDVDEGCCGSGWSESTYALAQLQARLENARGLRLLARKDAVAAEKHFARALALDGALEEAAFNRARALVRLKRNGEAVQALGPWLRKDSLAAYLRVLSTPDLSPLRDEPALRTLRAPSPGSARWSRPMKEAFLALQRERGLIAVGVSATGSYKDDDCYADLRILDLKTGALRASVPVLAGVSCAAAPRKAANQLLSDWGFVVPAELVRGTVEAGSGADEVSRAQFKGTGLGLVTRPRDGFVRLLRKNVVLVKLKIKERFDRLEEPAFLLPQTGVVVFFTIFVPGGDTDPCEEFLGDAQLIRVPPAAAR